MPDVIVVAYFDRLVRSVAGQAEILERVERAGGSILAVDVGEVSSASASQWLSASMLGAVAEYHRRVTAERTQDAKRRAVERGVPPFPNVPPGYAQKSDGTLEPHPQETSIVAEAFKLRAGGATVMGVRAFLREHGIERSFHGVQAMLASRVYLGELRFGDLVNTESHVAIVSTAVWQTVQRKRSSRGRRPKSDRLLARLGVLRCGTCGARMVIGSTREGYAFYRCNPTSDCPQRVTISADAVERIVVENARDSAARARGAASTEEAVKKAERHLDRCEKELDKAVRAFTGLEDVQAANERLMELRSARDLARERYDELLSANVALALTADDIDSLTRDELRVFIRAAIDRAEVYPGRGDRVVVYPRVK